MDYLSEIESIIFDNKNNITSGDYLKLMNLLKKVYLTRRLRGGGALRPAPHLLPLTFENDRDTGLYPITVPENDRDRVDEPDNVTQDSPEHSDYYVNHLISTHYFSQEPTLLFTASTALPSATTIAPEIGDALISSYNNVQPEDLSGQYGTAYVSLD